MPTPKNDIPAHPSGAFWHGIGTGLCVDLPYILDSNWRRAEYRLHRLFEWHKPPENQSGSSFMERRAHWRMPECWLFLLVLLFVAYGPSGNALCSLLGSDGTQHLRQLWGSLLLTLAALVGWRCLKTGRNSAWQRITFGKITGNSQRTVIYAGVWFGVLALISPLILLGMNQLIYVDQRGCIPASIPANDSRAGIQGLLWLLASGAALLLARKPLSAPNRVRAESLLLLLLALLLQFVAAPQATEAMQGPYLHGFTVLALVLALLACLAPWLAARLGLANSELANLYCRTLPDTELFVHKRNDPAFGWPRTISALVLGPVSHPLQWLLLPAFFVLMAPTRLISTILLPMLLLSTLLLMFGSLSSRWHQMVSTIRRWFLLGTPLAISLLVIALAVLRLAHVQYAATVLDAAPFGATFTMLLMLYIVCWRFESAINSAMLYALLPLLHAGKSEEQDKIPYSVAKSGDGIKALAGPRFITPHSLGRFAINGRHSEREDEIFHTWDALALFAKLTPDDQQAQWNDLRRRVQLYFVLMYTLVVVAGALFALYFGHADRNNTVEAVATVRLAAPDARYANLADLLATQAKQQRPAIIVAASGGGTRAALFAATTLEGLVRLGAGNDIVLMSGVSGGGVALAYFHQHAAALTRAPNGANDRHWSTFKRHMAEPFIQDVLAGATEWRFASDQALTNLLAESFERRLYAHGKLNSSQEGQRALILNATISGHPQENSVLLKDMFVRTPDQDCNQQHRPYALINGSRMVFTNLKPDQAFPGHNTTLPDVGLPFEVVSDPQFPLARAAALTANFPPVFPNARINLPNLDPACPSRAYYVNDGGAVENLGLISALYALDTALLELRASRRPIPVIHIVAIESSTTAFDYRQDRGVSAGLSGAKERLAGGLTEALFQRIREQSSKDADPALQTHFLPLPLAFRSRGGFGTHWMFPERIQIDNPRPATPATILGNLRQPLFDPKTPASVTLQRESLTQIWDALYDPVQPFCSNGLTLPEQVTLTNWICGGGTLAPDLHMAQWQQLVQALKPVQPRIPKPPPIARNGP